MIQEIKAQYPQKTIWLYTGFVWDDIKDLPFIADVDVLVDGPFQIDNLDVKLHWRRQFQSKSDSCKRNIAFKTDCTLV